MKIVHTQKTNCTIMLSLNKYVSKINIPKKNYIIAVDEAVDIDYSCTPNNAINGELDWISTNPEVLRVYNNRFRGLKEGTAEIIVRTRTGPKVEERIKVEVRKTLFVNKINIPTKNYIIALNEAVDIDYSCTPNNAINRELDWISTNPEVLRVYNNRFRGLKEGTAEIIVRTRTGPTETESQQI